MYGDGFTTRSDLCWQNPLIHLLVTAAAKEQYSNSNDCLTQPLEKISLLLHKTADRALHKRLCCVA